VPFERELKLTLYGDPPDFAKMQDLGGHALHVLGLEKQTNTYFDTPEFALARARWALRIRELETRSIVTLKGPGTVTNGLHSREELEAEVPVGSSLEALTDSEILGRIAQIANVEDLKRLVRLETKRHRFEMASVGELTLDQVRVLNADNETVLSFEEIELELAGDVPDGVLEAVENAICAIAPVRRSNTNKLQRALGAVIPDGQTRPETPWAIAASRILEHELERLRAYAPMALAGLDDEGVHGMRVSSRRLRAALKVFSAVIPTRAASLNTELRWLGMRLGSVRDLDVMIEALPKRVKAADLEADDLRAAVRVLERERAKARKTMTRALESKRYAHLDERLERLTKPALRRTSQRETTRFEGSRTIRRVYAHLRRDAKLALEPDATLTTIHTLRKTAKRLRYALEFLEPAIGKTAQKAVAHLKTVQERLGQINDASFTLEKLRSLAGQVRDAKAGFALGVIVGRLEGELMTARAEFERAWKKYDPKAEGKALRDALERD
jgi:triphosphatase